MGTRCQPPTLPQRRRLISRTTILILSGFLLGVSWSATNHGRLDPLQTYVFVTALLALLAFLGLDLTSRRRRQRAIARAQTEAAERLQLRFNRHLVED